MRHRLRNVLALAAICGAFFAASTAQAVPVTWVVDSSSSFASLAIKDFAYPVSGVGNATIRTRNQTGSATVWNQGNKAAIGGTLNTNYDTTLDSYIQFVGGQPNLVGINSGTYRPNPAAWNGAATNAGYGSPDNTTGASAVFGSQIIGNLIFNFNVAQIAFRDVFYDLGTSTFLPIAAGNVVGINSPITTYGIGLATLDADGFFISLTSSQLIPDIHDPGNLTNVTGPLGTGSTASSTVQAGSFTYNSVTYNRKLTVNVTLPQALNLSGTLINLTSVSTIVSYANVPEPTTMALASMAALPVGLMAWRRRRARRA